MALCQNEKPLSPQHKRRQAVAVSVEAQDKMLTREFVAGDGYASQNMLRLHFGLGDATEVEELIVTWPALLSQPPIHPSGEEGGRQTEGEGTDG